MRKCLIGLLATTSLMMCSNDWEGTFHLGNRILHHKTDRLVLETNEKQKETVLGIGMGRQLYDENNYIVSVFFKVSDTKEEFIKKILALHFVQHGEDPSHFTDESQEKIGPSILCTNVNLTFNPKIVKDLQKEIEADEYYWNEFECKGCEINTPDDVISTHFRMKVYNLNLNEDQKEILFDIIFSSVIEMKRHIINKGGTEPDEEEENKIKRQAYNRVEDLITLSKEKGWDIFVLKYVQQAFFEDEEEK